MALEVSLSCADLSLVPNCNSCLSAPCLGPVNTHTFPITNNNQPTTKPCQQIRRAEQDRLRRLEAERKEEDVREEFEVRGGKRKACMGLVMVFWVWRESAQGLIGCEGCYAT